MLTLLDVHGWPFLGWALFLLQDCAQGVTLTLGAFRARSPICWTIMGFHKQHSAVVDEGPRGIIRSKLLSAE